MTIYDGRANPKYYPLELEASMYWWATNDMSYQYTEEEYKAKEVSFIAKQRQELRKWKK